MTRNSSLFLLGAVLVGCGGDAPAPGEVRARIAKDLAAVIDTADASRANGASFPDTTQWSLLEHALTSVTGNPALTDVATTVSARMAAPADGEEADPFDGAKTAQWLNDNLFTDANHTGDGVFTVPASLACDTPDGLDPDCVQAFTRLQLRIRVSEDGDVLRFAVQLGPDHDEPLEVGLSARLLSLAVDLDETEAAVRALAPAMEGELPAFALDGKATAQLEVLGAAAARLSVTIDRGIRIRFADAGEPLDGPTAFEFSSQAAPVLSLGLDGNTHAMSLQAALGETHAKLPDEAGGRTELDLPGFTANLLYTEGEPLKIKDVGLPGAVVLRKGGAVAVRAELNPDDGRAFHGLVTGDLLEVAPRVDFRAQVDHAVLGEPAPVYDIRRILIEGGLRGRTDGVQVVGGTFAIETDPATYGFTATDGQCVRGSEVYDEPSDRFYTQFAVGACD